MPAATSTQIFGGEQMHVCNGWDCMLVCYARGYNSCINKLWSSPHENNRPWKKSLYCGFDCQSWQMKLKPFNVFQGEGYMPYKGVTEDFRCHCAVQRQWLDEQPVNQTLLEASCWSDLVHKATDGMGCLLMPHQWRNKERTWLFEDAV